MPLDCISYDIFNLILLFFWNYLSQLSFSMFLFSHMTMPLLPGWNCTDLPHVPCAAVDLVGRQSVAVVDLAGIDWKQLVPLDSKSWPGRNEERNDSLCLGVVMFLRDCIKRIQKVNGAGSSFRITRLYQAFLSVVWYFSRHKPLRVLIRSKGSKWHQQLHIGDIFSAWCIAAVTLQCLMASFVSMVSGYVVLSQPEHRCLLDCIGWSGRRNNSGSRDQRGWHRVWIKRTTQNMS